MLSVTLPSISDQTVLSGTTLNLALNGVSDAGNALNYTVAVSNANLTNSAELTTAVPTGNTSIKLVVNDTADGITNGVIIIQLADDLAPETVSQILALVEDGYYDGLTFHRIIEDFMIQGGDPNGDGSGGPDKKFDDQFNSALQFTSAGVVAMANSGSDTNGSQFFITTAATRWLDYRYSIFGFVTQGSDVVDALDSVATGSNDAPVNTVTITSIGVYEDTQDGVLRLYAPNGTTGTATVTVTATDSVTGETASQAFTVTVSADSTASPPYLADIDPIETTEGGSATFTIPAVNVDNLTLTYSATTDDSELTVSVNSSTGLVTVTPAAGAYGVYGIKVGVASYSAISTSEDSQAVPVYVRPAAPTGITLVAGYDTGTSSSDNLTNLNNSSGSEVLQFQVSGVLAGATVNLYADGVLIGTATATGTTATITTDGSTALADGLVSITATQTFEDQVVKVGNLDTTTDLASVASSALTIQVATAVPEFTFTPVTNAQEGVQYTCTVTAESENGGTITYALTESPDGMTIGEATGVITWTPPAGASEEWYFDVTVEATDAAGNTAEKSFSITVAAENTAAPELTPAYPSLGSTNEDTALTIDVWDFINNGDGTTEILDEDEDAIVGGIAITATTGGGTWAYSADGETFVSIGTVSTSSAFLVPAEAVLRYTPDGKNGGTATITYRAWDATSGASGSKVDTTTNGGTTAFSTATDTASLTVTSVNDAPVLTATSPSLGNTQPGTAVTVALATFINNGSGTTTITDVDNGAEVGGIALTAVTGDGTWAYSLDDGNTYTNIGPGAISTQAALLLTADTLLKYTPVASSSETATISYVAWDGTTGTAGSTADTTDNGGDTAFSLLGDTASLAVNTAPVLVAATPTLEETDEDTAVVIPLSDFINNGSNATTITDADGDAEVGGIALTAVTGKGTWAYSINDGGSYTAVGTVSSTSSLLLPADAILRYTPDGNNGETATITYRAWDTITGEAGNKVDTTGNGGNTAFSAATDTASLTVTDVNDAPVLTADTPSLGTITNGAAKVFKVSDFINGGSDSTTVTDVDDDAEIGGIALTAVTGSGTWAYSLNDGGTYTDIDADSLDEDSALLLSADALLRYTPTDGTGSETATITYRAWDGTTGDAGDTADASDNGGDTAFSAASDTASVTVATGGAASISGYVFVDTNNDGSRTRSDGTTHLGIPGVAVHLFLKNTNGTFTEVAAVLTDSEGAYSFTGLAAGTYQIQEDGPAAFLDGIDTAGTVNGSSSGTAGNDSIEVTLGAGDSGTEYNFGERGLRAGMVSLRCFLASYASTASSRIFSSLNAAPVVDLSSAVSGTSYNATYAAGGDAVWITDDDATITDADSTMLAWMTVTLVNRPNGESEVLAADTSGTLLSAGYSGGVLTINGAATLAEYQAVLMTVTYSNTDSSPQAGARTIHVKVSDGIEESNTAVATITVETSSTTPSGYSITADDTLVNANEASNFGFTFTGATVGATYHFTISSSGDSDTVTGSGTITSSSQHITGIDVSDLADGTLTVSATLTHTDGTVGDAATATATLDQTIPSGYAITVNDSLVAAHEASDFGFTFSGAEVGATYAYTVTSSGGSSSVTGSGTISSTTQSVTGINISGLLDGTLTVSVTLTDGAGNTGAAASNAAVLDQTKPSGYSITVDDSSIDASEASSVGFTFSGAEVGTTYAYTVTSSGGGTAVTGSGTVSSATQSIAGIDISDLPDGTLTFSATLTDAAGNVGDAVTDTAVLDNAPVGYSITVDDSLINAADASSVGFTISSAEVGATYHYTITSNGDGGEASLTGSGTVSSATQQVSGIDVSSLFEGTLTFSVTLTDTSGNVGEAATATATLDMTSPSGYSISADDALLNATEATSASFTFADAEVGTTYHYTVTSINGGTPVTGSGTVSSATQQVTGIVLSSLADGALTFVVTLTDAVGNTGGEVSATATLDKTAPSGYSITLDDNEINAAEATSVGFTFTGAEVGTTYYYTLSGGDSVSITGSGAVTSADQHVTGIDISSKPDGTYTFGVYLVDDAGNTGSSATATLNLDNAPIGYSVTADDSLINAAEAISASFTLAGAEVDAVYNYTITSSGGEGSVTGSGTVYLAIQQVTGIDVSTLPDGTLTFSVTLSDTTGNVGQVVTASATLDATAPSGYSVTADDSQIDATEASATSFTLAGAEIDASYYYTISSSGGGTPVTGNGTVSSATQQVTGIDVSTLPGGTLTFSVTLSDAAGNVGETVTATATLDNVPSGYTIAADDSLIGAAEASSTGFTLAGAEVGATYHYAVTSSGGEGSVTGNGTVSSATEHVTGIDVSSLPDGTLTFSVTLTDTSGNVGAAATADATLDKTAPASYTITADDSEILAAEASSTSFTLAGAEVGATYSYTVSSSGGGTPVTGSGTVASATQQVTGIDVSSLPDGTLTYTVVLTDPAGNVGAAAVATTVLDNVPMGYTIAAIDDVVNAAEAPSTGFAFTGAEVDATFSYTVTSSGGGTPVTGSGTVASTTQQVTGIDVSSLPDGTLTYTVILTDPAGNVGAAATASATLDQTSPSGYSISADDDSIDASEAPSTSFTFAGAEVGATYHYTVTTSGGDGSVTGSGTVSSATQQVTGIDVSALSDGTLTYSVILTDEAGNLGSAATAAATLDRAAAADAALAQLEDLLSL